MSPIYVPGKVVLAQGQPVPNDPNFAFNSLLLHGNGTNGSTVITDSSGSPKAVTAVGNAQISTAQSKFGGASIAFDGSGDIVRLQTQVSAFDFGADNFTLEAWVYRLNSNSSVIYIGQSDLSTVAGSQSIFYVGSTSSALYVGSSTYSITSPSPDLNTWAHVAWVRNGGTFISFLNGTTVNSRADLGTLALNVGSTNNPPTIGSQNNGSTALNGYIDDLRITKGVARYTANFTPPTLPFPDF